MIPAVNNTFKIFDPVCFFIAILLFNIYMDITYLFWCEIDNDRYDFPALTTTNQSLIGICYLIIRQYAVSDPFLFHLDFFVFDRYNCTSISENALQKLHIMQSKLSII